MFIKVLVILNFMGLLGKLKFWKKEDDFDFDALADKEMGKIPPRDMGLDQNNSLPEKSHFDEELEAEPPFLSPRMQAPSRGTNTFTQPAGANRDLELINSKLDTLKAILNSMDQRIAHLEQMTGVEKKQKLW